MCNLDGVLQRIDLFYVELVTRIDKDADADENVACADVFARERVAAGFVDHLKCVMVLIDDLHGHETGPRVGQGDRHRAGIQVEHSD